MLDAMSDLLGAQASFMKLPSPNRSMLLLGQREDDGVGLHMAKHA